LGWAGLATHHCWALLHPTITEANDSEPRIPLLHGTIQIGIMDAASSPPLTPIRQYMSPMETSPASSYRERYRRRTSSFSSTHDRSPTTPRNHRFSTASQYSNDLHTAGNEGGGGGLGNLADELDQLDDDEEYYDGDTTNITEDDPRDNDKVPRDSAIDVSFSSNRNSPLVRNYSKPFGLARRPPDKEDESEPEEKLSAELEDAMNSIARMTSYSSSAEDPLIPKTIALLQDLGNQSGLEARAHRLTTSTNSMTSNLGAQSKAFQAFSSSLYSVLTFSAPLDPSIAEETAPLVEALLKELPLPDTSPLQGLQKLERETANVIQSLSQLTDTLQMGKQLTTSASRHLKTTQTMVADLRRERERADLARHELVKGDVEAKLRSRTCATACRDVVSGFEEVCDALRESLIGDVSAAA